MTETILIGLFCAIFGFILGWAITKPIPAGTLRIDRSDPMKDIYRFEITDFAKLNTNRTVTLIIEQNANLREENSFYNE